MARCRRGKFGALWSESSDSLGSGPHPLGAQDVPSSVRCFLSPSNLVAKVRQLRELFGQIADCPMEVIFSRFEIRHYLQLRTITCSKKQSGPLIVVGRRKSCNANANF
jgi:hypothetical protein